MGTADQHAISIDEQAERDLAAIKPDRMSRYDLELAYGAEAFGTNGTKQNGTLKEFRELPDPLPAVPKFDLSLLPVSLQPWVEDSADGLQVPAEFCAVPAIVAAAGVIGRQMGIRMKQRDLWVERPILWGAVIGRPSSGKSPALRPAQRMLTRIEGLHRQAWEKACRDAAVSADLRKEERGLAKREAAKALKAGDRDRARDALDQVEDATEAPPEPRLVVNDATIEKLGEILNGNPRGLVQFRDELAGWLATLDREGREGDRGFWLECWNGVGPYTCDRIGRGTIRIEAPSVSILGGVQPGKLAEYVRGAVRGGMGDDGLLQRFQLSVFPDLPSSWRYIDREPTPSAEIGAWQTFQRLDKLSPMLLGAERHPAIDVPFLRLSDEAQELFIEWQTELMLRLRAGGEAPYMESHLAKFPGLVGRLALVLHLCDHEAGPVGIAALSTALEWCEFLEPHARRIYSPAIDNGLTAAHLLLKRRGDLLTEFTARDVYRRHWAGLDRESVENAIEILVDHGHMGERHEDTGGRPLVIHTWRDVA